MAIMAPSAEIDLFSKLHVAVSSVSFSKNLFLREELKNKFPNCTFNESGNLFSEHELINFLKNKDAVIVGTENITEKIIRKTPQIKVVSKYGVGLDNIDQKFLKKRRIALRLTEGVNRRSVAELTLCFMLGLCRNVFDSGFKLKGSEWEKNGGHQLSGKTVGIIGCGHIGSDVVRLLLPFGCNVLIRDIIDKSDFCREQGASEASLSEIIKKSDLISLHVPLTAKTRKMVNESFLQKMKPTAFLINTCRGEVIHQEALKTALNQNNIAKAALDVFIEEPPTDEKFLSLPNLMVTPHIGGNAQEAVEAMGRAAIDNLTSFFKDPTFPLR